jgi:hypothetical protein
MVSGPFVHVTQLFTTSSSTDAEGVPAGPKGPFVEIRGALWPRENRNQLSYAQKRAPARRQKSWE